MKRLFTLAATLLVLGASSASAQSGLTMYWNGCSDGGVATQTFACNTNTGAAFAFYGSVILPNDMPSFAATSAIFDITFEDAAIPAWWLTNAGQCRANAISVSFDAAAFVTNCPDIWQSAPNLSVFQAQQGTAVSGHAANTLRLNSGAAVPAGSELNITADGSELVICKVSINRTKTTGTGLCAGCNIPACIVFNEAKAQQPAGIGDYTIVNEAPGKTRWITWNGSPTNCPDGTPAQNRTWGAVKNLYR